MAWHGSYVHGPPDDFIQSRQYNSRLFGGNGTACPAVGERRPDGTFARWHNRLGGICADGDCIGEFNVVALLFGSTAAAHGLVGEGMRDNGTTAAAATAASAVAARHGVMTRSGENELVWTGVISFLLSYWLTDSS